MHYPILKDFSINHLNKISFSIDSLPSWLSMSELGLLTGIPKNKDVGTWAQGNQSGRDRMTSTTELRGANVPKGMFIK